MPYDHRDRARRVQRTLRYTLYTAQSSQGGRPQRRPCTPQTRFSGCSRSVSRGRLVRPRDQSMQSVLRGPPNSFWVEATHNLPVPCPLRDPCIYDRSKPKVKTCSGIRRSGSNGMRSRDGIWWCALFCWTFLGFAGLGPAAAPPAVHRGRVPANRAWPSPIHSW